MTSVLQTEDLSISRLLESLQAGFPHVPEARLRACVHDALAHFDGATVRTYIPLLVARRVRAALSHDAGAALIPPE